LAADLEEITAVHEAADPNLYRGQEGSTLTGNFRMHRGFVSRHLDTPRDIIVYLPPTYDGEAASRFSVLYLHDGQNIFDCATAFGGNEWRVDETAQEMIEKGEVAPLIIVGIYNTGEKRIDEYTPTFDKKQKAGGKAPAYARFIVEELKPFIDESYRTLGDRAHTGIGGSSLGGLVSIYIALRHTGVFGRVAALSPSIWWNRRSILRWVRALTSSTGQKIWIDSGTNEGRPALNNVRDLRELLVEKGWVEGKDLAYLEAEGAGHDEAAWAARFGAVLGFLFPRA
jgi:predicted alpha/beta superfamily hydrolase